MPVGLPMPDLSGIFTLVKSTNKKVASIAGKILKVLSLVKAVVAVVLACVPLLSTYTNKMRGALA